MPEPTYTVHRATYASAPKWHRLIPRRFRPARQVVGWKTIASETIHHDNGTTTVKWSLGYEPAAHVTDMQNSFTISGGLSDE
jgi:hypothetical protein